MSRMMLPQAGAKSREEWKYGKLKTEIGGRKMKEEWKECKCTFRMERRNLK